MSGVVEALLLAAAGFLAGWLVGVQVERIHGWAHNR